MNKEEKSLLIFREARSRMLSAFSSYFIWKHIIKSININEVGLKEAEKNVERINKYSFFTLPTIDSHYQRFILCSCLFFESEKYEDTLSLGKLKQIVKDSAGNEAFINLEKEISEIKRKNGKGISLLIKLRNEEVVHRKIDINKKPISIEFSLIEDTFRGMQDIFNKLSKFFDDSSTMWDMIERDAVWHTNWVIENIDRGEIQRLKEIKEEYPLEKDQSDF